MNIFAQRNTRTCSNYIILIKIDLLISRWQRILFAYYSAFVPYIKHALKNFIVSNFLIAHVIHIENF